jgi:hypothetical protein
MLPNICYEYAGAQSALQRHALIAAAGEQPRASLPREVCQRCGRLRHVASTIPVYCAGQGIELVPLCGGCTREVSR